MSVIFNPTAAGTGSGITQLTGDVTAGPGSGSQPATLASIIVAGGPIGDATHTPVITWDAKGRLTAVSSAVISGGGGMAIGGAVTSGTPGSVLFVGAGPTLAQDNANFFWDDTNQYLKIANAGGTAAYYINGVPSVYQVLNGSGNNWFEGNAGTPACTGPSNFGTGDFALSHLTTGSTNIAVGSFALYSVTTGTFNVGFGYRSMINLTTGVGNYASGDHSLDQLITGSGNLAFGPGAIQRLVSGNNNVGIGASTLGQLNGSESSNTALGFSAGGNCTGSQHNVFLGYQAGGGMTSGDINIFIGENAGFNATAANNSVFIGAWPGVAATMNSVIAFSTGGGGGAPYLQQDYNYTTAGIWSFSSLFSAFVGKCGLHVYNVQDTAPPTNYERAVFDWKTNSNILTIGTQAGGTGTVRPIKWAGLSNKATPVSGDHVLLLDSITSDTMKTATVSSIAGTASISIGSAVGSGTSGSVLFVDGSSDLAQDNANFFWDDTNYFLKLGHASGPTAAYYTNGARALYTIPNVSGNNWFEGNAGNLTVSGYANFGTGDSALLAVTTGYDNVAVGTNALTNLRDGFSNFALGANALRFTQSDANNTAIGTHALETIGVGGAGGGGNGQNVAIGFGTLNNASQAFNNVVVGFGILGNIVSAVPSFNVIVGAGAAGAMGGGGGNCLNTTLIGANAGGNLTAANQAVFIGGYPGPSGAVGRSVAISDGGGANALLDFGLTSTRIWSFNYNHTGDPTGVHIYNFQDALTSTVNYERAILDWIQTTNVFRVGSQAGGTGTVRLIAIDGFSKAGAPAAGDLPSGSFAVIDDTSGGNTWLVFNKAGTIRKVQLV